MFLVSNHVEDNTTKQFAKTFWRTSQPFSVNNVNHQAHPISHDFSKDWVLLRKKETTNNPLLIHLFLYQQLLGMAERQLQPGKWLLHMEKSFSGKKLLTVGNCMAPRQGSQASLGCRSLRICSDHKARYHGRVVWQHSLVGNAALSWEKKIILALWKVLFTSEQPQLQLHPKQTVSSHSPPGISVPTWSCQLPEQESFLLSHGGVP